MVQLREVLGAQSRGAAQTSANLPWYLDEYNDPTKNEVPGQDIYSMVSQSFHEAHIWICNVMSSCYMLISRS